jgi:hypothetical protein
MSASATRRKMTRMKALEIVIPVHNEHRILEHSVRTLHAHVAHNFTIPFQITIADNASSDADLSTDLSALGELVTPLLEGRGDIAIGSRLAPGAQVSRTAREDLHGIMRLRRAERGSARPPAEPARTAPSRGSRRSSPAL